MTVAEENGNLVATGIHCLHDSRKSFQQLQPDEEWFHSKEGILVSILAPGQVRLRQASFDYTFERNTIVGRQPILRVPAIKNWLSRTHQFLVEHHVGDTKRLKLAFSPHDQTWVEAFFVRMLVAASELEHGGTIVIKSGVEESPFRRTYCADSKSPAAVLDSLHGSLVDAYVNRSHDSFARFATRRNLFLAHATAVGRLTALDGCVVIDSFMRLQGFGWIVETDNIRARDGLLPLLHEGTDAPMSGLEEDVFFKKRGTRHSSAALLCKACPHTIAIVLSQDGDMRVFASDDKVVRFYDNVTP